MNNIFKIRLKSGALQFAIYTSAIVALLLLGLILYVHTFKTLKQNTTISIDNIKATNLGFFEALKSNEISSDTLSLSNLSDKNQKVKIVNSIWGIFQKADVISKNRNKSFYKSALIGSSSNEKGRVALYLKNNFKPLIVVGNTKIEGEVMIPQQGVQSGYIAGNGYFGDQLIYGKVNNSSTELSKLNISLLSSLDNMLNSNNNFVSNFEFKENGKMVNSFQSTTKVFNQKEPVVLTQEISGNFIIKSETSIRVTSASKLKDIILIAPEISIEDGVSGNFQSIANDKIEVGKKVQLSYPSALVINNDEKLIESEGSLSVQEFSSIRGVILYKTKKDLSNSFQTHVKIAENVKIMGEVYCEGNLELKGSVWGSIYTHQFVSNTAGTIFINHLYNAKISSKDFPIDFSGILIDNQSKNIMKWLY